MGKKKNVSTAGSSGSNLIENLKTLNINLVKEVAERRKQIQHLRIQLSSMASDRDIVHSIESSAFRFVVSCSLDEAAALSTAEMAAATEKVEFAAGELNAAEIRLLDLVREKDALQRDLEGMDEEIELSLQTLEKAEREKSRKKKWFYPVAAAAILCASTAKGFFCYKDFKFKS